MYKTLVSLTITAALSACGPKKALLETSAAHHDQGGYSTTITEKDPLDHGFEIGGMPEDYEQRTTPQLTGSTRQQIRDSMTNTSFTLFCTNATLYPHCSLTVHRPDKQSQESLLAVDYTDDGAIDHIVETTLHTAMSDTPGINEYYRGPGHFAAWIGEPRIAPILSLIRLPYDQIGEVLFTEGKPPLYTAGEPDIRVVEAFVLMDALFSDATPIINNPETYRNRPEEIAILPAHLVDIVHFFPSQ